MRRECGHCGVLIGAACFSSAVSGHGNWTVSFSRVQVIEAKQAFPAAPCSVADFKEVLDLRYLVDDQKTPSPLGRQDIQRLRGSKQQAFLGSPPLLRLLILSHLHSCLCLCSEISIKPKGHSLEPPDG